MSKFAVGDTVIYAPGRAYGKGPTEERKIAKVGRKYVYLEPNGQWWLERKGFSIETGRENAEGNYPDYIYTPADYEAEQSRRALVRRYRDHWHTVQYPERIPTPTLEKLLAVLDAAADQ